MNEERCPECHYLVAGHHSDGCSQSPIETQLRYWKEIVLEWKKQCDRYRAALSRNHELVANFHGKYMIVKHENNKLRNRLFRQHRRDDEEQT